MIIGTGLTIGIYTMTLIVSGATGSDSKTLTVNVGESPIISTQNEWGIEQNKYWYLDITSTAGTGATYNVIGVLPQGLSFATNVTDRTCAITGIPIQSGEYYVTIMATNPYGEDSKELKIIVVPMGQY
jgi:PKD repeat protein